VFWFPCFRICRHLLSDLQNHRVKRNFLQLHRGRIVESQVSFLVPSLVDPPTNCTKSGAVWNLASTNRSSGCVSRN
jgi:hypothetical protein